MVSYKTCNMLCYITHNICYKTHDMLRSITDEMLCYITEDYIILYNTRYVL